MTTALAIMGSILRNKNIQALLILLLSLLVYRLKVIETYFGLSTASVQYVLIIPLLLALALFSVRDFKIPKLALILALGLSCVMALIHLNMNYYSDKELNIFLSPFADDDAQVKSIKFQNLLKASLESSQQNINYVNLANPVESIKAADAILKNARKNSLLIAGSDRWLSIYFAKAAIPNNSDEQIKKELDLKLVSQVKSIGLSDASSEPSKNYVSLLARAYGQIDLNNVEAAQALLVDAASIYGRWTTPAHRAYPYWLAGTLQLQTLSLDNLNKHQLLCAIEYYNKARKFLHDRKNPELLAAILNNRGVAQLLAYVYFGKKEFRRQGLTDIKKASKLISNKSDPAAWGIAKENNWLLNQADKAKNKSKKKKNKKKKNKKAKLK